jgi:hypothetical protein
LISTVATGTAPLTVSSTTKVTNLNADLLDGNTSANFALLSTTQTWTGINTFTTDLHVSGPLITGNDIVLSAGFWIQMPDGGGILNSDWGTPIFYKSNATDWELNSVNGGNLILGSNFTANVVAYNFINASSIRYKDILYRESVQDSLNKVCSIGELGVAVGTRKNHQYDKGLHRWFIAEEIAQISPISVVNNAEGDPDAVNYIEMIPDLYAAIAALKEEIDYLKSKII